MNKIDFRDWRVHLLCLAMVLASEAVGSLSFKFGALSFTLLPMLYALVIGIFLAQFHMIKKETMETASPYIGIAVMFLSAKMGANIGPNLEAVFRAGPALLLQEFGNLGTILFSLPFAVLFFKMGRTAVGCCFSISRESSLAIVGDVYGLDSREGQGIMGAYITGTLLGTIFNGLMASFFISIGIFHPYALAMAAGTGSTSMMTAALAPVVDAFPQMADQISAYAASSQVLTGVDGMYMSLFVALPLTNWLYKKMTAKKHASAPKAAEAEK